MVAGYSVFYTESIDNNVIKSKKYRRGNE